jgi:hypothetical protein
VGFILVAAVIMLLICTISLPLHVFIRKLSFIDTITDLNFWALTLSISILIALLVGLSDS